MIGRVVLVIGACSFMLGCLGLPSEQWVARHYEAEHPGAKVVNVTKTSESRGGLPESLVRFHIEYMTADKKITHDTWTYGRVAEGWLRGANN